MNPIFYFQQEVAMRTKSMLVAVSTAAMLLSGAALAQKDMKPGEGMPMDRHGMMGGGMMGGGTGPGMMGPGMMGGGMMGGGMMGRGMMGGCPMGGAPHAMPQLPPGNEKLQLQMHAEMMQHMGAILAKYAAQLK
jgi:hypothetical protein